MRIPKRPINFSSRTLSICLLAMPFFCGCNLLGNHSSLDETYRPGLSTSTQSFDTSFILNSGTSSNFNFDSNAVSFTDTSAQIKGSNQTDQDASSTGFGWTTSTTTAWSTQTDGLGGKNYLKLATQTNTSELSSDWAPLPSHMIAIWHLNDGSNPTTIADSSGQNHSGTPGGDLSCGIAAKLSTGCRATSGNISFGSIFPFAGNSPFTISLWFSTTISSGYGNLLSRRGNDANGSQGWLIYLIGSTGQINFSREFNGNETGPTTKPVNDGRWHHLVLTYDGATSTSYLDGFKQGSSSDSDALVDTGATLFIGNGLSSSIDEVGVWDAALNNDQVESIYARQSAKYAATFSSRVMSSLDASQSWQSLSWIPTMPFSKPLPDNGALESASDYSSLSGNLSSGLTGLWHLDETSGTVAHNSSGSSLTSTYINSPLLNQKGLFGSGVTFSKGYSQSITTSNPSIGDQFTFSFWANIQFSNYQWQTLAANSGSGGATNGFRIGLNTWNSTDGIVHFETGNGTYSASATTPSGVATYGVWHNYVFVVNRASSAAYIYVDGVLSNSGNTSIRNDFDTSSTVSFGTLLGGGGELDGELDEIGLWSRDLTSAEVSALYRRGANRLKFQVRTCTSADCSDDALGSKWQGYDNSTLTYLSEANSTQGGAFGGSVLGTLSSLNFSLFSIANGFSPAMLLPANQYFQYRVVMESDDPGSACNYGSSSWCSPELKSVTVGPNHLLNSTAFVSNKTGQAFKVLTGFSETLDTAGCTSGTVYIISKDGAAWYYWNGTAWVTSDGTAAQASAASDVSANLTSFSTQVGGGYFYFKAFLKSNGTTSCNLSSVTVSGTN